MADANGLVARQIVDVRAGLANAVTLEAFPERIAPDRQTSLRATVIDEDGNPVPDAQVRFGSSGNGAFDNGASSIDATTNSGGVAFVNLTAIGTSDIATTVEVVPDGLQASSTVLVSSGAVQLDGLQVTALSSELPADGVSQTRIRAAVSASDGAPVEGATVAFSTSAGTIEASAVTDANGIATATLTAPSQPGNATVSAQIGGLSAQVQVVFSASQAENIALSLVPSSVAAGDAT
ncbi:MAG: Ig-like domain-containing protein, partial [Algiphilus sp.]